jgi:hypothetical protein
MIYFSEKRGDESRHLHRLPANRPTDKSANLQTSQSDKLDLDLDFLEKVDAPS